jgi:D-alanyl-D-alanine carboxypeptidase/D-alanyl-D-alanine-endopeptidase (penicillin-binding protein 4)
MNPLTALAATWEQIQAKFLEKAGLAAEEFGVEITSLPAGRIVWSHRAQEPLIPASLLKIATSYAALKTLGPAYRFRTAAWAVCSPQGGILPCDIWLRSEGDYFWTVERATELALQLKAKGVHIIRGRILADNSYFAPPSERVCLDESCEDAYNPTISGTALEFNTVVLRIRPALAVGKPPRVEWYPPGRFVQVNNLAKTAPKRAQSTLSVRRMESSREGASIFQLAGRLPLSSGMVLEKRYNVDSPATSVAAAFTAILEGVGVQVESGLGKPVHPEVVPKEARILVEVLSPPLAETIYGLNRHSNNFMAEMLLRSMGAVTLGPPGTEVKGLATLNNVLKTMGAPTSDCVLKTGSGLSRACRMSPRSFGTILVNAFSDGTAGPGLVESLAVNGQEGTMKRRLSRSAVTIRGKTGTLRDVVGFAGYVSGAGRPTYAVVIMLNGVHQTLKAKEAIDTLLEDLGLYGPLL